MTATDERTVAASPFAGVKRGQLIDFGVRAAGVLDGVKAVVDDVRGELLARGRREYEDEGTKPSWKVDDVGSVGFTFPDPSMVVSDHAAFAAWVAEHRPTEVAQSLRVSEHHAEKAYEVLQAAGIPCELDRAPRTAWVSRFLQLLEPLTTYPECTAECVTDDNGEACVQGAGLEDGEAHPSQLAWVDPSTGIAVAGVTQVAGGNPFVTLRPEKEIKTELSEQVRNALTSRATGKAPAQPTAIAELVAKSSRNRNEKK